MSKNINEEDLFMETVQEKPCLLTGILYQTEIKHIKNKLGISAQMNSRAANGLEKNI